MATSTLGAGRGQADSSSGGTGVWQNPGNITADDATYSDFGSVGPGAILSYYLRADQFGFSIPTDATINGITVTIQHTASHNYLSNYVEDTRVSIVDNNGNVGATNKYAAGHWLGGEVSVNYGGATDLWDIVWTPAKVNDADFGAVLCATATAAAKTTVKGFVDYISITVHYTVPSGNFFLMW